MSTRSIILNGVTTISSMVNTQSTLICVGIFRCVRFSTQPKNTFKPAESNQMGQFLSAFVHVISQSCKTWLSRTRVVCHSYCLSTSPDECMYYRKKIRRKLYEFNIRRTVSSTTVPAPQNMIRR